MDAERPEAQADPVVAERIAWAGGHACDDALTAAAHFLLDADRHVPRRVLLFEDDPERSDWSRPVRLADGDWKPIHRAVAAAREEHALRNVDQDRRLCIGRDRHDMAVVDGQLLTGNEPLVRTQVVGRGDELGAHAETGAERRQGIAGAHDILPDVSGDGVRYAQCRWRCVQARTRHDDGHQHSDHGGNGHGDVWRLPAAPVCCTRCATDARPPCAVLAGLPRLRGEAPHELFRSAGKDSAVTSCIRRKRSLFLESRVAERLHAPSTEATGASRPRGCVPVNISALALDYDGTIALDDALDPAVRDAIAAARTAGLTVLLVTGRILDELRRVAGDLHFVDVIVAENGAVVSFPHSDHLTLLAPPVPAALDGELQRLGVPHQRGQSLIDASADDGTRILEAVRALEVPYVLLFNRSRVMMLPQGVSKATGLRAALEMLRLSPRNTVAVGDAENDHELLRLAEIGAAVEWGSQALKAAADVVVAGAGPPAVAAYIADLARTRRLPAPTRARRRLLLGYTEDGREFSLAVRGRNVLVAGDAKSGKSWVAGLLCEQLILHGYCVCVIDPEGDYRSLEGLPGVSILGGEYPPPTPRELMRALRYPDRSVVIDLSRVPHDLKIDYIGSVLPALNVMRRRTGLPHRILVDEAHYFLHDVAAHHLLDLELNGYPVVTSARRGCRRSSSPQRK